MWTFSEQPVNAPKANASALGQFAVNATICCLAIVWLCWPSLVRMQSIWTNSPQYSHGYLVPFFVLYLLWYRRHELIDGELAPSWWGLPALAVGIALKWAGTAYFVDYLDDAALVVLIFGAVVIAGGMRAAAWSWQGILFLLFMVPLPYRLETAIQQSLLRFATVASTYALQTLGYAAFAEGNVIHLPKSELGVLDACSGLRMGIVCTAMAALAALVSPAPLPQRLIILLSGVPLALLTNVVRISLMGMISEAFGQATAERIFHDLSGLAMVVFALILLFLEIRLLTWIYDLPIDDEHRKPLYVQQAT